MVGAGGTTRSEVSPGMALATIMVDLARVGRQPTTEPGKRAARPHGAAINAAASFCPASQPAHA